MGRSRPEGVGNRQGRNWGEKVPFGFKTRTADAWEAAQVPGPGRTRQPRKHAKQSPRGRGPRAPRSEPANTGRPHGASSLVRTALTAAESAANLQFHGSVHRRVEISGALRKTGTRRHPWLAFLRPAAGQRVHCGPCGRGTWEPASSAPTWPLHSLPGAARAFVLETLTPDGN